MTIIAQALDQPSIANYITLQDDVAAWLHRTDLGAQIPRFIALAEDRIKARLWASIQDVAATLETVAGEGAIARPADFLHMRALSIPGLVSCITYVTPEQMSACYRQGNSATPRVYTLIGEEIHLGPVPDAVYPLAITYQARFLPLSDLHPTNALLAKWPNLYLWATCAEGAKFLRDLDAYQAFESSFDAALDAINKAEWNAPGALTVRTDVRAI